MNCHKFVGLSLAVCLLLCFVGESDAQNEMLQDVDSLENEGEVLETVRDLLEDVQTLLLDRTMTEREDADSDDNKQCSCDGLKCICCRKVKVKFLKIKTDCCVKVTWLGGTSEIQISVKLGSETIFKQTYSAREPKPLCVDASLILKKGASVCLDLYDVRIRGVGVSGCVRIQFKVYSRTVAKYRIGCFRIKGSNEPAGSSSFDQPELPATDGDDYDMAEDDLLEPAACDGEEPTGGQKESVSSPDDEQVVPMENIEMPVNDLGENQL